MTNSTTSGLDNTTVLDGDDLFLVSKKSGGTYLSRNVKYSVIQNSINKVITDLSPLINSKANQTDLDLTNSQVNLKADQTDLVATNNLVSTKANSAETTASLNLKANQADLIATNNIVNTKASQVSLDATNETVNQKANTVDVYSKTDLSMTKRIQDANEFQLGAGANGWTDLLVALSNGRTQRDKNSDAVSVKDFGGVGGGANDTAALNNATNDSSLVLFNTQSLITNSIISKPLLLMGSGENYAKTTTTDASTLIIADTVNHGNLVKNVTIDGINFKDQPTPTGDNTSALHFNTADGGIAKFSRFNAVNTAIRVGYYLDGAISRNCMQIGNDIVNAKTMGIELIYSNYNRTIANNMHNDGVTVGQHAIRWAYGKGNVAVGNVLRDRGTTGISLQVDSANGVAVGNYIENCGQSGIQTNTVTKWAGKHFIGGFVIKNAVQDGVKLNLMTSCFTQGLVDSCAQVGVRTDTATGVGKHVIDMQIINAGQSGAIIGSDKNFVRLLIDANITGVPLSVTGNDNLIIVVCADTTVSNAIFITGSRNTVIIQEAGTGTVGLRVDGNDNVVSGRVTGQVAINGSRNVWNGNATGSMIIGASADSNVLSGQASNITDNGTNTNFSCMIGASTKTVGTFTTAANGVLSIPHNLKRAPKNVQLTLNQDSPYILTVTAVSATTITVKVRDAAAAGAALAAGIGVAINWSASM